MRAIHLFSVALMVPVALGFGPVLPKKKFKIRPIPIMAAKERVFNMRSLPPIHTNTHFVPVPQPLPPPPPPPVQHFTQVIQPPRPKLTHTQNFFSTPQHINIPPAPAQKPTSIKNNIWLSTKSDVSGSQTSTATGSSSGSNGVEIVQPLPKIFGTSGGGGTLSGTSINDVTVGGRLNKIGGTVPFLTAGIPNDRQFGLSRGSVGFGVGSIGSDQSLFTQQGTNFGAFGGGFVGKGLGNSATGILDIHGSNSAFPSIGGTIDSGIFMKNIQTPFIQPGLGSNFQRIGNEIFSSGRVLSNPFISATGNGFHPGVPTGGGFVGTSVGGSFGIPSGSGFGVGNIGSGLLGQSTSSGFGALGLGNNAGSSAFGFSNRLGNAGLSQFSASTFGGNGNSGSFSTRAGSGIFGNSGGFGSGVFGNSGGFAQSVATLLAAAALKKPVPDHEPGEGNGNILQLLASGLTSGGGGGGGGFQNLGAGLGFNGSIRRFLSSGGGDGGSGYFSNGDDDD